MAGGGSCGGHDVKRTSRRRRLLAVNVTNSISSAALDDFVLLNLTADAITATDVMQQVLVKTGKADDPVDNYVLVEDVQKSWDHRDVDKGGGVQRVMDATENVLHVQNKWKGTGRFLLRKKSSDLNIRFASGPAAKEPKKREGSILSDASPDCDAQVFIVCVYNVFTDQPHRPIIFHAPVTCSAQDVVAQALSKTKRAQETRRYALCVETTRLDAGQPRAGHDPGAGQQSGQSRVERRTLADDECVFRVQTGWTNDTAGRFIVVERKKTPEEKSRKSTSGFLQKISLARLSSLRSDKKLRLPWQQHDDDVSEQRTRSACGFRSTSPEKSRSRSRGRDESSTYHNESRTRLNNNDTIDDDDDADDAADDDDDDNADGGGGGGGGRTNSNATVGSRPEHIALVDLRLKPAAVHNSIKPR